MFGPAVASLLLALSAGGLSFQSGGPGARPDSGEIQTLELITDCSVSVVEGIVLDPGGLPSEGAIVMDGGDGHTITDVHGRYRLELTSVTGARSISISAFASAGASGTVRLTVGPGATSHVAPPLALAQSNPERGRWAPTYGIRPGAGGAVNSLLAFDDGGGPALFAAGEFSVIGGVAARGVARLDGTGWAPLGSGLSGFAHALAGFDDGTGLAMYVGGDFALAGGQFLGQVARWDGTAWMALGSGVYGEVRDLEVFDDGTGLALYVAGDLEFAGGMPVSGIARWDGSVWSTLGNGTGGGSSVEALELFDDGSGLALFAGGYFSSMDGIVVNRIAKWDGSTWSALGSGMNSAVLALEVFDDGNGPELHAGGRFTTAGGSAAVRVAKWDGSSWSALGGGVDAEVQSLAVFDDGGGPALFVGGRFDNAGGVAADAIARWDGASWSGVDDGMSMDPGTSITASVRSLSVFDGGSGAQLVAAGFFHRAGGQTVNHLTQLNGGSWERYGRGLNGSVSALAQFDDGFGTALYAGGDFESAGPSPISRVAKWDGSDWSPIGGGPSGNVRELVGFDDGTGAELYAGGDFIGGVARWDGATWAILGGGVNDRVEALAVHDDGMGEALYAAGHFTSAGGGAANRIAKWDGTSWTPLGAGIDPQADFLDSIRVIDMVVFDDGSGPALFVCGKFYDAGDQLIRLIAKWDGTTWSGIGPPYGHEVLAMTVVEHASGDELWAVGDVTVGTEAGGFLYQVARWDGSWSSVGGLIQAPVSALATLDSGDGPTVYVGGFFSAIGAQAASHVARWDGNSWRGLGPGTNDAVHALLPIDSGSGPALVVGGRFTTAYQSRDGFLGLWRMIASRSRGL